MTAEIRAINCPTCGAGQTVPGGGRIRTHVCPYCGSALDALDDFRLLARYDRMSRPAGAMDLGRTGRIRGVEFTVIGIAGWVERHGGRSWRWTDHQVFSPTHGYGWITREDTGHWTFTRKLRAYPRQWLSPTAVEMAETRPRLWVDGQRMAYYETSLARIDFLEGAFNWLPEIGTQVQSVTLVGIGRMVTLTGFDARTEREIEQTRLLDPDERESFGLGEERPRGRHPLQAGRTWRHHDFVMGMSAAFLVLALVTGIIARGAGADALASTGPVAVQDLPVTLEFDAPARARLFRLQLDTDLSNGWAYFNVGLEHVASGDELEAGRDMAFYWGRDADGRWSEGSNTGRLVFPAGAPGPYRMTIDMPEYGSGETGNERTNTVVEARVIGLRFSWRPLLAAAGVFALMAGATFLRETWRHQRLLTGSDWTED